MTMTAAIYARKSTEQTGVADEQKSVARQVEHARAYAATKGWTVDDSYVFVDDGISGAEFANRPGFLRLMNALKPRAPFAVLIMSEVSRLGREQIETAYALKQLSVAGVRCFGYLDGRELLIESATDKFLLGAVTFAADFEREKARQRTYDAMSRKAKAGHVTGGRVFGYDNLEILGGDGRRSHVERRINTTEAEIVRRIFQDCADGMGVRTIAKRLNADRAPAPRAQRGRPVSWSPSSVWELLRRPLYRGEIVWNATQKRNSWGQKHPRARDASEWIRRELEELRIVPEDLWTAADARLTAAREEYVRRSGGQTWGRPVNGRANSPYLLTGLGQCGVCGGGLFVRSWKSGAGRAFGYGCSSHYLRGRTVCENRQMLPMPLIDGEVLTAFRDDLLDPAVVARAFQKLRDRLAADRTTAPDRPRAIEHELAKVEAELSRLATAVADGGNLSSLLAALRAREAHREELRARLATCRAAPTVGALDLNAILPELRRRMNDWRCVLAEEPTQAREMLRTLLDGRIVFTPNLEARSCVLEGRGNMDELFRGLIELPKALASPTGLPPKRATPFHMTGSVLRVA